MKSLRTLLLIFCVTSMLLITVFSVTTLAGSTTAGTYTITNITNTTMGYHATEPQINGNGDIAWIQKTPDTGKYDVYLNGTKLTNNTSYKIINSVRINDSGQVAWIQSYSTGVPGRSYFDVCLSDGPGDDVLTVSSSTRSISSGSMQMSNNGNVVWSQYSGGYGTYDIWLYDSTKPISPTNPTNLTNNPADSSYYTGVRADDPQINDNGHVVWSSNKPIAPSTYMRYNIYLYDGTVTSNLTQNTLPSMKPQINNNGDVVWHSKGSYYGYNADIYLYDGTGVTNLTVHSVDYYNQLYHSDPQINDNGHVIWHQKSRVYSAGAGWSNVSDIYLYDGSASNLTKNPSSNNNYGHIYNLQINNSGHIVWDHKRRITSNFNGYDAYIYDGADVTSITDKLCSSRNYTIPQINDNGHVVLGWDCYKDGFSDVYLITPGIPNTPPVADAGPDQTVEQTSPAGAEVALDGTGSYDDDGDTLTYTWTGPFGTVTGPIVTVTIPAGISNASLVVNDGTENSTLDSVIITVKDTTPPHNVVAKLEPIKVRKRHGCFRVVLTAEDNGDANPLTFTAVLKTDTCQEEVSNGDLVRLHLKKRCRIKHDEGSSGDRDSDDNSSADCGTVKVEGPDFTLTTTATDARGNESDSVNAAPPVFGHDGGSHDDGSSSGHKKRKKKHHGSDDDSRSSHKKKGKKNNR